MRRPAAYAPLSVTFATGKTGSVLQDKLGLEGLAAWACLIAAAKRGAGQVVFAHDRDWQAIGVMRAPEFSVRDFLKTTGQLKQTRTTRHGHVMYVQLTSYERWNNDARRQDERERKTRYSEETNRNKAGRLAEHNRKQSASELELDLELEEPSFLPSVAREPGRTEGEDINYDILKPIDPPQPQHPDPYAGQSTLQRRLAAEIAQRTEVNP